MYCVLTPRQVARSHSRAPAASRQGLADAALQVENILVLHSERLEGLEAHAPPLAMQS